MSLFTLEEVCSGSINSNWHEPCMDCYDAFSKFCHCSEDHESSVSFTIGKCEYKNVRSTEIPKN